MTVRIKANKLILPEPQSILVLSPANSSISGTLNQLQADDFLFLRL